MGTALVVVWRLMAVGWPHPAATDPTVVRLDLLPLGLLFVVCGLWAWHRSPGPSQWLFALYALTAGMHWGGPVGLGSESLRTFELVLYMVMSSLLGQTLLLHLALVFPRRLAPVRGPAGVGVLYLPAGIGAVLALGLLLAPRALRGAAESGVPILFLVGMLFSLTAVLIWIGRLIWSREDRRNGRLALLVAALLASALPAHDRFGPGAVVVGRRPVQPLRGHRARGPGLRPDRCPGRSRSRQRRVGKGCSDCVVEGERSASRGGGFVLRVALRLPWACHIPPLGLATTDG